MSMWLSAANKVAGTLRGQATAEVKRQVNAAVAEATKPAARPKPKQRPAAKAAPAARRRPTSKR